MEIRDLPLLNAVLNAFSAVLLLIGFYFIRSRQRRRHHYVMLCAFVSSCLFLTSYLIYHASVGSVRFGGSGVVRYCYFAILTTHTFLAAATPVLAVITLWRALRGRFDKHRAIARWTLPIWLYVSLTGIIIYFMVYRLYPPA